MEALYDLAWRGYPAALMTLLGAVLTVRGARLLIGSVCRSSQAAGTDEMYLLGFRLSIWGLSLVGVAAAWTWQIPWLLAVALVICFEETIECSWALWAVRRRHRLPPIGRPAGAVRARSGLQQPGRAATNVALGD